ncbi:MAG: zinc ribbon domain-containing protein, partial [Clostridia bacterium]
KELVILIFTSGVILLLSIFLIIGCIGFFLTYYRSNHFNSTESIFKSLNMIKKINRVKAVASVIAYIFTILSLSAVVASFFVPSIAKEFEKGVESIQFNDKIQSLLAQQNIALSLEVLYTVIFLFALLICIFASVYRKNTESLIANAKSALYEGKVYKKVSMFMIVFAFLFGITFFAFSLFFTSYGALIRFAAFFQSATCFTFAAIAIKFRLMAKASQNPFFNYIPPLNKAQVAKSIEINMTVPQEIPQKKPQPIPFINNLELKETAKSYEAKRTNKPLSVCLNCKMSFNENYTICPICKKPLRIMKSEATEEKNNPAPDTVFDSEALPKKCLSCGQIVGDTAKFCDKCGSKL